MTDVTPSKKRPVHLDLIRIKLPLPGIVSILHRISGFGLFLSLPFLLCIFQSSLASPETFAELKTALANPLAKLIIIGLVWAYLHHFCAGIRYLFLDLHIGIDLKSARASSYVVLAVSLTLTVLLGVALW